MSLMVRLVYHLSLIRKDKFYFLKTTNKKLGKLLPVVAIVAFFDFRGQTIHQVCATGGKQNEFHSFKRLNSRAKNSNKV